MVRVVKRAAPVGDPCVHCKVGKVNRPRGLCWPCYHIPGVKEQYPSTSMYARRGVSNITGAPKLPSKPTTEPPGTPAKIEVMGARAALGHEVFHPADAKFPGDTLPLEWLEGKRAERKAKKKARMAA